MIEQLLISIDQFFNVLVYIKKDGFGFADETLSARAWRLRSQTKAYRIINTMFFWQQDHCRKAYESEMQRRQLPPEYRKQT